MVFREDRRGVVGFGCWSFIFGKILEVAAAIVADF